MTNLLNKDGINVNVYRQPAIERGRTLLVGSGAATLAFAVYILTLSSDLSWEHNSYDGGELITAAVTLGVPHPPGYPSYVLLGKLISFIPIGTVAFRFNLLSAVCVAAAAALLAITSGRLFFGQDGDISAKGSIAALAAALAFAFTPLVWGQAVITEVYGFNLASLAGFLYALVVRRSYRLAGLLLGLSITAHLTSLFFLPLAIGLTPRHSLRNLAFWLPIGLTPLLSIPLLAQTGSPVVWGQPTDLQGWWWLVSGRLYHDNLRFPLDIHHMKPVLVALFQQFAWLGIPLAIAGALGCPAGRQKLMLMTTGLYIAYALLYHTADALVILLPALLLLAILLAPALHTAGMWALALPLVLLLLNFQVFDAGQDRQVRPLAENVLSAAPENAILLTPGDRSIFALWYFHHVEGQRPDVILVDSNLFAFSWYRQRLEEQHPGLQGLAADNLLLFHKSNQEQRPVCQVRLVANESDPPSLQCNKERS